VWCELPTDVKQFLRTAVRDFDRGALHAIEHVLLSIAPLHALCEIGDLSCQHTRRDGDRNRCAQCCKYKYAGIHLLHCTGVSDLLLLFETSRGGSGLSAVVSSRWFALLDAALRVLQSCACAQGCPQCVHVSQCGDYNEGLDKGAAKLTLTMLLHGKTDAERLVESWEPTLGTRTNTDTPAPQRKRGRAGGM
jgi:DEAD/DEAH box helicase domain-containing protein